MDSDRGRGGCVERWAASGAMALTGRADGPALGPPADLVPWLDRTTASLPLAGIDPLVLLADRAAAMGLTRQGTTSCGGAARLLRTLDAWVAVSLAREDDVALLPAWLEAPVERDGDAVPWGPVEAEVATRRSGTLVARANLVGLPVARLGEASSQPATVRWAPDGEGEATDRTPKGALVVDLTSLWAGPLCGDLLAAAGADVIKVESSRRPDGARWGNPEVFDQLNARKRSVALDFTDRAGRSMLRQLVDRADIVIEASRPRAIAQLGVDARDWVRAGRERVWISITGYGRDDVEGFGRVAFGDDAAVGGGLVAWEGDEPRFCADAIADPLTGVAAAAAAIEARARSTSALVAISMAGVAAAAAGPTLAVEPDRAVAPPRARRAHGRAPALGADTATVLAEWRIDA